MIENSLTFPWDLGIATILGATLGIVVCSHAWLRSRRIRPLWMKGGVLIGGSVSLLLFLIVFYGSFIEPQIITVTHVSIPFGTVEPLNIAVISDLHVGPYKGAGFIRRVVARINALHPDAVFIVGDLVLAEEVTADQLASLQPLGELSSLLGTYAIMGNHDHSIYRMGVHLPPVPDHSDAVAERLTSMGVHVLRNESNVIRSGENLFAVAGIEDALSGKADIVETLRGIPHGTPTFLLSHNPDVILDPASLDADIIIAGHTHGGQIRLPWYGALATLPTHLGQKFDQGVFRLGSGATLAITRGIGESGPRARLFAPPEILMIETVPNEATPSI